MTQDFYQHIREQLSQAIQEQSVLVQEKAIQASHDFISSMREIETMPCNPLTAEELDNIRDSMLNIASCDECSQPVKDSRKCDNCGDVLCKDCSYYNKDDYYEDNDVVFCFQCWSEEDEETESDEYE